MLSPLLFSAPDTHLVNLEKMWVDGIMHAAVWQQSIAKLNDEWQEFILYVRPTVLRGSWQSSWNPGIWIGHGVVERQRRLVGYSEH